jgi:hypothetical protein
MTFCKDCRWADMIYAKHGDGLCLHPLVQRPPEIDPVTGVSRSHRWLCSSERSLATICGPDGKLWEPKDGQEEQKPAGFV